MIPAGIWPTMRERGLTSTCCIWDSKRVGFGSLAVLDSNSSLEVPMAENQKCAHPACNCIVTEHHKYCSEYCHDARETVELSCNCGHPGCAEELTHRG